MSYQNFLEKLQQNNNDDLNFFKNKKKSTKKEDRISIVTTGLGLLVFTLYAAYAVSNVNDKIKSVENYHVQKVAVDSKRTNVESKYFTDEDMKILQKIIDTKEKTTSLSMINGKFVNSTKPSVNSEEKIKESIKSKTNDEQYKQIMGAIKGLSDIEKQLQAEKQAIPALNSK